MTEERARELIAQHGCKLLPDRPGGDNLPRTNWLVIVTERLNQKWQCPIDALPEIEEADFIKIITGNGKGMRALPGVYSDYKKPRF
jgi:hypothetical protein